MANPSINTAKGKAIEPQESTVNYEKEHSATLRFKIRELTKELEVINADLEDCKKTALFSSIFFRAALQCYQRSGGEFNRFFAQTDYFTTASKIMEAFVSNDKLTADYLSYVKGFQDSDVFLDNFKSIVDVDAFSDLLLTMQGTGILGGFFPFASNFVASERAESDATGNAVSPIDEIYGLDRAASLTPNTDVLPPTKEKGFSHSELRALVGIAVNDAESQPKDDILKTLIEGE